ncbi:hypothetical protein BBW65_07395 [Helicobacter enhydrae]|uniref:Lipoprotein n=1 Tax=Helicobacter enhydrae TaxID=222136 RepID=A0A1B1U7C7_9HELI|nr:hypothetical protein [Helicobacter enhydrae]ANV98631.1 hypothetical protein BBW65_07395 [Helicobacter enhydrae]
MKLRYVLLGFCIFWVLGCSNLSDMRFSQGFAKEKQMQLTRKADVIVDGRTIMSAFCIYLNELKPDVYQGGEYFVVELSSEEKVSAKALRFLLFDQPPVEVKEIVKNPNHLQEFQKHSQWNQLFLVRFAPVWQADIPKLALLVEVDKFAMKFDYSYRINQR